MKEVRGTATTVVSAPVDRCFMLLATVERYPVWHPQVVKSVEVIERDTSGVPSNVRALLRVAREPVARDFDVVLTVELDWPRSVVLHRVPHEPSDPERFRFAWQLEPEGGTRMQLDMQANLDVPAFLPLGKVGDSLAAEFVAAAARALE